MKIARKLATPMLALLALVSAAPAAQAQSMYPMVKDGVTFNGRKAVMLTVINPYGSAQKFRLTAYERDLATPTEGVTISPAELTLGASASRRIKVVFDVPQQERAIAVCVQPVQEDAQVVPRVCGRYSARRAGQG